MTLDECQQALIPIRRQQGTPHPLIQVKFAGQLYVGRLARSDSDPEFKRRDGMPFGVLVLEDPGLARGPQMILQIASIPAGGIRDGLAA